MRTKAVSQVTHAGAPAIGSIPGSAYTHPDAEFTLPKWSPDSRAVAMHWDDRRRVRKLLFPDYLGEQLFRHIILAVLLVSGLLLVV